MTSWNEQLPPENQDPQTPGPQGMWMPPPAAPHAEHPGPSYWYPPQGAQYGPPPTGIWVPQQPQRKKSHRAIAALAIGAVVALTAGAAAIGIEHSRSVETSALSNPTSPNSSTGTNPFSSGGSGSSGNSGSSGSSGSSGNSGTFTDPGQTSPFNSNGNGATSTGQATSAQSVGVVDINTVLNYGQGQAAGTGMILTSNGEILTNNHVVKGSTSISVVVVSTGKTYTATVVGTDPTDDVAVLQLKGASGLSTAKLGTSTSVAVGNAVTAVGNAGGTGGTPSAAAGTITALNQHITASDEGGGNPETLTGLIETDANVQAGDSGGPLYASNDTIIGMDTAASSGSATTQGYAIPIAKALSIADQIEAGKESSTIHIGASGFLGVETSADSGFSTTAGASIIGVIDNSAAANAGLAAGDTVTAVDGTAVTSASQLSTLMGNHQAGQQVSITWVDSSGQSHSATVTLGTGPAD